MSPGDVLQKLTDALGHGDDERPGFLFDRTSVCLSPRALAEVLRWAADNPGQARVLAEGAVTRG